MDESLVEEVPYTHFEEEGFFAEDEGGNDNDELDTYLEDKLQPMTSPSRLAAAAAGRGRDNDEDGDVMGGGFLHDLEHILGREADGGVLSLPESRSHSQPPSRGGKRKPSWEDIKGLVAGELEKDLALAARCESLSESGSCQSPLWSDVASAEEVSDNETDWARLCSSVSELRRALEEEQARRMATTRMASPFLSVEDEERQDPPPLWSPPRQRRRISVDSQSDPICVEVPPSPSESKRSTPSSHLSPLLSPVRSKTGSLSPSPSVVAGLIGSAGNEPHARRNIFTERSKLPANFHPHSHSNLDTKSNRSSYFSMISSAARFLFRTVIDIDLEGETGTLSLMDTSNLVQARVYHRKYEAQERRRDCYNLHGENEHCEDCAEEYDL